MAFFTFRLENEDGTPADPPVLHTGGTELAGRRHDSARPRPDPSRRHGFETTTQISHRHSPGRRLLPNGDQPGQPQG